MNPTNPLLRVRVDDVCDVFPADTAGVTGQRLNFIVSGGDKTRDAEGAEDRDAECAKGVRNGEGTSHPRPTTGSGERHELPQRGPGRSTGRKRF